MHMNEKETVFKGGPKLFLNFELSREFNLPESNY